MRSLFHACDADMMPITWVSDARAVANCAAGIASKSARRSKDNRENAFANALASASLLAYWTAAPQYEWLFRSELRPHTAPRLRLRLRCHADLHKQADEH